MNLRKFERNFRRNHACSVLILILFLSLCTLLVVTWWNLLETNFYVEFDMPTIDNVGNTITTRTTVRTFSKKFISNDIISTPKPSKIPVTNRSSSYVACMPEAQVPFDVRWKKTPKGCTNETYFVWLIKSSLYRSSLRKMIRMSWGQEISILRKDKKRKVKRIFIIGSEDSYFYSKLSPTIDQEHSKYQDLLQGAFLDTFASVTEKLLTGMNFVKTYCQSAKFVFIADDDAMILPWNLLQELPKSPEITDYYGGFFTGLTSPIRNSSYRWYVSYESYKCDWYPTYAYGSMFVLSYHTMEKIFRGAQRVLPVSMDDVFVGALADDLNIPKTEYSLDQYSMCEGLVKPHDMKPIKNLLLCHGSDFAHVQYLLWSEFCHSPTVNQESVKLLSLYCRSFLRVHWGES